MRELLRRLSYLWNRRRLEREMAEEMAYHREQLPPERRTSFGDELRLREDTREVWGWGWFDRLRQDLSYGARVLGHARGFTLTAMLVLALGIGVPLTAFRAVLADLQGGSAPHPETLVHLTRRAPGVYITNLPYPQLAFYSANAKSFRQVIGLLDRQPATFGEAAGNGAAEPVRLAFATANYCPEFGLTPALGRLFTTEDERPDAEPVALLGELFWQRRLGSEPAVIGSQVRVNGKLLRVVGLIPRSSKVTDEIWIPLARQPYVVEGSKLFTDWSSALDVYARLSPGVAPEAARQETLSLAARLRELQPSHVGAGEYLDARPVLELAADRQEFQILMAAAVLVLLLLVAACANLGTLVLARGVTREREIRIRMALGAGRMRVVRQLFTESLLLAVLSGACGLLLSTAVLKVIQLEHNSTSDILPDWRAIAATFLIALLAALVFGLPPALRLTSLVPRAGRARTIFLTVQVASSCLLLVVSSLLVSGRQKLVGADPGFDHRHLVWVSPGLKAHGYNDAAANAYLNLLRARAAELPDARAASTVWLAPWGNVHMGTGWQGRQFAGNHADPEFLGAMGLRLARGRNFLPGETGVALISEAAEHVLWPDGGALGQPLPWDPKGPTVVGIVRNASTTDIGNPEPREFYLPHSSAQAPESVVLLRVAGDPHVSARRLQEAARALDPRLQPTVQVVTDSFDREVEKLSRALAVIAILGVVAILLSAIGLAGLAGYTVAQRTREIGLRIALGARSAQVVRAILAPMNRPLAVGFTLGALGAAAAARILRAGMPAMAGLNLFDPLAYMAAVAFFVLVVALAVLAPGRRAIRINPSQALQHE
ncbi:ABC transporter permease [Paludibaculum fermentans]|uniref:ABC transporter permease n=1 Tax=Paludibaculum fermentans TaxID=1473598 RepID=A0A7S7NRG2_PALFE|nr:ABC transporter permease [Paludibaculum fermentans]QOY88428.1 ABC transporter permease [Paludibaculum fermentans]